MNAINFPETAFLRLLDIALLEDIPTKDITTEAIVSKNLVATATIIAKENGVVAGLQVLPHCFGPDCQVSFHKEDGDLVSIGEKMVTLEGTAANILTRERIALNFLQRCSGIATLTRQFVDLVKNQIHILGTRKTPPGYRELDRYSIVMGGGVHHRGNLSEHILIKENHFYLGRHQGKSFEEVLKQVAAQYSSFQAEVETLEEAKIAAAYTKEILLDNMSVSQMEECIQEIRKINPKAEVEASGGLTLENSAALSQLDLNRISLGCLTHSVKAFDFSLKIKL